MSINRNNYEEYFILYMDNELESEDRRQVETFAQENPDLKTELEILLQSRLVPDTDVIFDNKELLMIRNSSSISIENHEEWLLSYTDNELTEEERKDVEHFVAANPVIQKELNLLQQTKLQPEAIVFPYKKSLYRQEEKAKVVAIRWGRIAAAAVLLLGISITAIVLLNNKKDNSTGGEVVKVQTKEGKSIDNTVKQPEKSNDEQVIPFTDQNKNEPAIKINRNTIAVKQNKSEPEEKKEQPVQVKSQELVIAKSDIENHPTNNLTTPDNNPYVKGQTDPSNGAIASIDKKETLTVPQENTGIVSVTPGVTHTSQLSTTNNEQVVEQPSGNKGLRGFLRKVTRTFEKRTHIKATDDDDRLLIAGLAIKM